MDSAAFPQPRHFAEQNDLTPMQLSELMKEYLAIKKVELDVSLIHLRSCRRLVYDFSTLQNIFAELHPDVRKRVYAMKNLLLETIKLDSEFHHGVYDLEKKFQSQNDVIFKKRFEIINGLYDPNDDECKFPRIKIKLDVPAEGQEKVPGVPTFWLTVMKNVNELSNMIQEDDEKVLKHLIDIRAFSKPAPDLGFQLEFHFEPNEFFQNSVLTKTYLMSCRPDDDDPFSFEGPEIYKSVGCEIMWNAGNNVVENAVKKRDSLLSLFKSESFFNFFKPPELTNVASEANEKIEVSFQNQDKFIFLKSLKSFFVFHSLTWKTILRSDTT